MKAKLGGAEDAQGNNFNIKEHLGFFLRQPDQQDAESLERETIYA
jgi:hypothetical protein